MSGTPGEQAARSPSGARARAWWAVALAVALAVLALLVWRPWQGSGAPVAEPSSGADAGPATPSATPTTAPSPKPSPSPPTPDSALSSTSNGRPTTPSLPTGRFDATTARGLFVTAEQLAGTVPAAHAGLTASDEAPAVWGLPAGAMIVPADCGVALTIVTDEPAAFEAQAWAGDAVAFRQEVTLLASASAARAAFATLVGTVDACPQYREADATAGGETWTAQPAIEGLGLFPSIVQDVSVQMPDAVDNGYRGHLLVGNAIVTWTARTPSTAAEALGPAEGLSAIVQDRALAAVRALG